MLSRLVTSVLRPAQYRSSRSEGFSEPIAEQKSRMSPEPTGSPAARSSRENATSTSTSGARAGAPGPPFRPAGAVPSSGTGGDLFQVVLDQFEVVAFLHHGAERVPGHLRVQ